MAEPVCGSTADHPHRGGPGRGLEVAGVAGPAELAARLRREAGGGAQSRRRAGLPTRPGRAEPRRAAHADRRRRHRRPVQPVVRRAPGRAAARPARARSAATARRRAHGARRRPSVGGPSGGRPRAGRDAVVVGRRPGQRTREPGTDGPRGHAGAAPDRRRPGRQRRPPRRRAGYEAPARAGPPAHRPHRRRRRGGSPAPGGLRGSDGGIRARAALRRRGLDRDHRTPARRRSPQLARTVRPRSSRPTTSPRSVCSPPPTTSDFGCPRTSRSWVTTTAGLRG